MSDKRVYEFIDPMPLGRALVAWLYVHIAVDVLFGLASLLSPKSSQSAALTLVVAGLLMVAAYLVVAFLVLKWIYRVSRNAHSAAQGLTISPPWAVGWFFVPVAFLWKPFQGLREAWQVSCDAGNWRAVPVPALLRWWWALFLISNFLGQLSLRLTQISGDPGLASASSFIDAASTFVDVPLDLVFIVIVRQLSRRQVADMTFGGSVAAG